MRDIDIRRALKAKLVADHTTDPTAVVIDELGVCQGSARVDVAVVNSSLAGFEIKSDLDTLLRLPAQTAFYGRCFDMLTLVTVAKHLPAARDVIPTWWGILRVEADSAGGVRIVHVRRAKANRQVDPSAVVQLLWRDEALAALAEIGFQKGMRALSRRRLWEILAREMTAADLRERVRTAIKARGEWRSARRPTPCSGSGPTSATSSSYQQNLQWLLAHGSPCPHG